MFGWIILGSIIFWALLGKKMKKRFDGADSTMFIMFYLPLLILISIIGYWVFQILGFLGIIVYILAFYFFWFSYQASKHQDYY